MTAESKQKEITTYIEQTLYLLSNKADLEKFQTMLQKILMKKELPPRRRLIFMID